MKNILKLEALGLCLLFSTAYFYLYPGTWGLYLALFFVPDLSFLLYLASKKAGAIAYNIFHHQGIMATFLMISYYLQADLWIQVSIIFLAHSAFDRAAGYGLKYFDSFNHTHLGWIGKGKSLHQD